MQPTAFRLWDGKKMHPPLEIEVRFIGGGIQVQHQNSPGFVNPADWGMVLMPQLPAFDCDGVRAFAGDVIRFPHFKKDGVSKNGSAYRILEWSDADLRYSMTNVSRGKIVGNVFEWSKKPINKGA